MQKHVIELSEDVRISTWQHWPAEWVTHLSPKEGDSPVLWLIHLATSCAGWLGALGSCNNVAQN